MANSGDRDDQNAASRPSTSRPAWGKVSTTNMPKCREQDKPGEYPKRRSDDEY